MSGFTKVNLSFGLIYDVNIEEMLSLENFFSQHDSLIPLGSSVTFEKNGKLVTMERFNAHASAARSKSLQSLRLPRLMIVITPTYPRDNRQERLCRLGHFLAQDLHVKVTFQPFGLADETSKKFRIQYVSLRS